MTIKVRITNIIEPGVAESNGDLILNVDGVQDVIYPGDTTEFWFPHMGVTITERWPSRKPTSVNTNV